MNNSLLKEQAAKLTRLALAAVFNIGNEHPASESLNSIQIVYPPDTALGHCGFACHRLAKTLRLSPQAISEQLADYINKNLLPASVEKNASLPKLGQREFITRAHGTGGYLNFFCDLNALYALWSEGVSTQHLHSLMPESSSYKSRGTDAAEVDPLNEKVMVEFSQPNTHKALHIGHMRNMIYGDAVCRLLKYNGTEVVKSTFPGDMGTHIAKALWFITRQKVELPLKNQATWLGHQYAEADQFLRNAAKTPEEIAYKGEISEVLKQLENKSGSYYELYLKTRQWSLAQMRSTYDWLGIEFDRWFFESECDQSSKTLADELYQRGFFVQSQGAIGLDLSEYNLGFAVYLKSDGTGLYITKDLELIRQKFEDKSLTRSIVVVDSRQKLHFQQLFKTAELLKYTQPGQSIHLSYESVVDEQGRPFSSRDLNGTSVDELREMIHKKVISEYLNKYKGIWPDEEILKTADDITLGALKYGMLRYDSSRIVKFVLSEWIQLEGETGPYLQYTHARCLSVLEKVKSAGQTQIQTPNITPVTTQANLPPSSDRPLNAVSANVEHPLEQHLLLMLERFHETAVSASHEFRPSILTAYLFDLARLFNRFYKECPIKKAENETQRSTRLGLVRATAYTLKMGLSLLGIPAPSRL